MRAKVWNDSDHDWSEVFKGEKLHIPARKFIEMEFYDAHEFKSQYSPIKIKADDTQDEKSYKRIRVEKVAQEDGEVDRQEVFPCNLCKKVFNSEEALIKHSAKEHADDVIVDAMAEESVPKRKHRILLCGTQRHSKPLRSAI